MRRTGLILAPFLSLASMLLMLLPIAATRAAAITVCPSGCDYTSIQAAMNVSSPGDTILVASGRYMENITITGTVTIQGAGVMSTTIDGNASSSVILIQPGAVVTITGVTITNGRGISVEHESRGGGIHNLGALVLVSSTVGGNTAVGIDGLAAGEAGHNACGGGIYNGCLENTCGTAMLMDSTVAGNTASGGKGAQGNAALDGGAGGAAYGGGIYNGCAASACGLVTLLNTSVISNVAWGGHGGNSGDHLAGNGGSGYGGGVYNSQLDIAQGVVTVSLSSIMSNAAYGGNAGRYYASGGYGGGGGIGNSGVVILIGSTLGNNRAYGGQGTWTPYYSGGGAGGGIYNSGQSILMGSAVYGNDSDGGGGLVNGLTGLLELTSSTVSSNMATYSGGGLGNSGILTLTYTTVGKNRAGFLGPRYYGQGGGIYNNGLVYMKGAILAENIVLDLYSTRGQDCFGTLSSQGHNLVRDTLDCTIVGETTGNILSQTAFLLPLQDNGGPTPTHALWFISPAIDAGDPAYCPSTDQRGMPRPTDGNDDGVAVCDIGAYEGAIPPASRSHLPIIWK